MIELRYDEDLASPGTWRLIRAAGELTARATCPNCGISATLQDHEIDAAGVVHPSLDCPREPPCGFHDHVRLVGWVPSASGST